MGMQKIRIIYFFPGFLNFQYFFPNHMLKVVFSLILSIVLAPLRFDLNTWGCFCKSPCGKQWRDSFMVTFLACFHERCEVAETWLHRKVRKSFYEVSDTTIYILLVYTNMKLSFCFAMFCHAKTENLNTLQDYLPNIP